MKRNREEDWKDGREEREKAREMEEEVQKGGKITGPFCKM